MKELFKGIDDVATALCADESCTLECSAMLLGLMTRRLLQNRLNEKNREAALHAYSLERVCERIRRIARLGWSHPHAFQDDTHGRCTLYRLLGDPLESITTRINNEEFANLCRKRPQVLEESDEEAVAKRLKQDREQEQ
jgi:GGDEF domain-containing protein